MIKGKIKATILLTGILLCIILRGLSFAGQLDDLVAEALKANPDLKAVESRYKAFQAGISQAGSLPDPMVMVGLVNLPRKSLSLNQMEMSGIELGISQEIPILQLGKMKQVARQEAESQKQSYNSLKNYLISQVKQNYYDLWYWQKVLQITTRNKSLLQDLSKNASVRYSVGEGIQQDVLQAQIELTDLLHDEVMIAEQIKSSRAKLNILLNKNPQESLSVTEEIGLVDLKRSESELQLMAMESSPLLAEVKAMSAATKAEYQLAKREYWPSFELGGTYMIRQRVMNDPLQGEDLLSFRLSMNLPLYFWSRQSKKVAQTSLKWQSSQREYEGKVNQIKLEISRLYYELESLKERLRLHNDLLGLQAHQSLDAARAAYQVNKVDFATVLKSYQAVYEYETEFNRLFASYMKTRAELESVVGRPLE